MSPPSLSGNTSILQSITTEHIQLIERYYEQEDARRQTLELLAEERIERRRRREHEDKLDMKKRDSRKKRIGKKNIFKFYQKLFEENPDDVHLKSQAYKYGLPTKQKNKRRTARNS